MAKPTKTEPKVVWLHRQGFIVLSARTVSEWGVPSECKRKPKVETWQ